MFFVNRANLSSLRHKPPRFRLVFEDTHLIVVDKPAGILTQPGPEREHGTLLSQIHRYLHRKARGRRFHLRSVHRLDRDTSGLLVFSKSALAHKSLLWQFKHRRVEKNYLAIVEGILTNDEGTFRSHLVRNRGDRRRGSTQVRNVGKEAVTHYCVLERLRGATFVEIRLETGRTHQIRIHFAEAGFPLVGEPIYQPKGLRARIRFPRQALHAHRLSFAHPLTGKPVRFTTELPEDLHLLIEQLRTQHSNGD